MNMTIIGNMIAHKKHIRPWHRQRPLPIWSQQTSDTNIKINGSDVQNKTFKMFMYLKETTKRGLWIFQQANSDTKIASPNELMHKKKPTNSAYDWVTTWDIFWSSKSFISRKEIKANSTGVLLINTSWTSTRRSCIIPACGTMFVDPLTSLQLLTYSSSRA